MRKFIINPLNAITPQLQIFKCFLILNARTHPNKEEKFVAFDLVFYSGGVKKQGGMGRGAPRSRPTGTGLKKSADLI